MVTAREQDSTDSNMQFFDAHVDIDTLAQQQGVSVVTNPNDLVGDFWPEDETDDELIATLRGWRREGVSS
jgi:hypothetical protein